MVQEGLTRRTLRGLGWATSGSVLQSLIRFTTLTVTARLLSPHDFGVAAGATIAVSFAQLFTDAGFAPAMIQRRAFDTSSARSVFTVMLILGTVFALAVSFGSSTIASLLGIVELKEVLRLSSALFIVQALQLVPLAIASNKLMFPQITLSRLIAQVLSSASAVVLAVAGLRYWALAGAQVIQGAVEALLFFRLSPHSLRLTLKMEPLRRLFSYAWPVTAARVANWAALQGDNLVTARTFGADALGAYGKAYQLLAFPSQLFGQTTDTVVFPVLASIQDDTERLRKAMLRATAMTSSLTLPAGALGALLAPEIISAVFGDQWRSAVPPFRILCLSLYFRTGYKVGGTILRATGRVQQLLLSQILYGTLIVSAAWLGGRYGLAGIATGVSIAICLHFLVLFAFAASVVQSTTQELLAAHSLSAVLCVVVAALGAAISQFLRAYNIAPLLLLLVVGSSCLAITTLLSVSLPKAVVGEHAYWWIAQLRSRLKRTRR